ncbi:MAG: FAD:protein FMN transferase [Cocleimonas sp.]|nr:FAD:protein FMN transferase [Cocleimonas sp.]
MGTQYHISIPFQADYPIKQQQQQTLQTAIDARLIAINQDMSTYQKHSTISQFNQSRQSHWFPVSKAFLFVIQQAQRISDRSNGAFDITIMPLVNLWGFGTTTPPQFPQSNQIEQLRQQIGYQALKTQSQPPAIKKIKPQLMLDLSAIAKGYAVDEIAKLLEQQGFDHFLVEIGGEIRTKGHNKQRKPWRIAIEKPTSLGRFVQQGVLLHNIAIATSGDYRNYYEKQGVRYSHTLDPKTGRPITHQLASVTVLNDSAMIADAEATTIMVMGEKKGKIYAQQKGLTVYMIFRDHQKFSVWHNLPKNTLLSPAN